MFLGGKTVGGGGGRGQGQGQGSEAVGVKVGGRDRTDENTEWEA